MVELLRQYVEEKSEEAFAELVRRHINLVYSAALRQVGNHELARDVAQTVFTDLAAKARRVPANVPVSGWLYRHTCFTASKLMRSEARRRAREEAALTMSAVESSDNHWEHLAPVLDDAMNSLGAADRNALVLRFFEGQDLRAVAAALRSNEGAVQKRISRALEKLRRLLSRRGIALSSGTLGSLLAAHAVSAAPQAFATAVAASSLASVGSAAISWTIWELFIMSKLKTATVAALVAAGVITPVVIQRNAISNLRAENADLRQQLASGSSAGEPQGTAPSTDLQRLNSERNELLRLRAEVGRLRGQTQELAKLENETKRLRAELGRQSGTAPQPPPAATQDYLPRDSWANNGFATPQSTLQTLGWAIGTGNAERFKQSVVITDRARQFLHDLLTDMHPQALEEAQKRGWGAEEGLLFPMMAQDKKEVFKAFRITSESAPSPDEVVMETELETNAGRTHKDTMRFRRFGQEWKRFLDIEDLPLAQDKKTR